MNTSAGIRRARAAAEAADWLDRLSCGEISPSERAEFVDWLRESPLHVAETLRIERLRTVLTDFDGWQKRQSGEVGGSKVVDLQPFIPQVSRGRATAWRRAAAAAVAAVFLVAISVYGYLRPLEIQTGNNERREIALEDGSLLRLSPDTTLHVRLSRTSRSILLDHGEAAFQVARDVHRPFIVTAARARVEAVGTIFTVARNADNVVVTVTEGRVTVAPSVATGTDEDHPSSPIALQVLERVSVSAAGAVGAVRTVEAGSSSVWGENQLVFQKLRVDQVVSRFNRHNRLQIRVDDKELAARVVSGVFASDDPGSFIEFLTTVADARSRKTAPDEIVIEPR